MHFAFGLFFAVLLSFEAYSQKSKQYLDGAFLTDQAVSAAFLRNEKAPFSCPKLKNELSKLQLCKK